MSGGGSVTAGSTVRVAALFSGGTLVHSVAPVLTTTIAVLCHCVWVCVCVWCDEVYVVRGSWIYIVVSGSSTLIITLQSVAN